MLPLTFMTSLDIAPGWNTVDRDAWLRAFWPKYGNDILQAVLAVSIAKIQTQNWELEGPKRLVNFYHRLFRDEADFGAGYSQLVARGVQDYYTQDNGWFIERMRSGPDDLGGPCLGVAHIDSARMHHTGFNDYPFVYLDVDGSHHLMHRSQFIRIVDMPTPVTGLRTPVKGFCALSRALSTAVILSLLTTMKREKLSDLPPGAIAIFNNINKKQFESALTLHDEQHDQRGSTVWRSLLPLFGIDPAHPADIKFVPLREVWENFDELTAYNVAVYSFAAAWRMDPREFWPVSSGPLGTGKEAEIQHEKAKAKSSGLLFTELERAFNADDTLSPGVSFKFRLQDAEEEQQRAEINHTQIENVKAMQDAGAQLSASEVRWLLATQYRILPSSMLPILPEGTQFEPETQTVTVDDVERRGIKEYYGFDIGQYVVMDDKGRQFMSYPPYPYLLDVDGNGSGNGHKEAGDYSLVDAVKILPAGRRTELRDQALRLVEAMNSDRRLKRLGGISDEDWEEAEAGDLGGKELTVVPSSDISTIVESTLGGLASHIKELVDGLKAVQPQIIFPSDIELKIPAPVVNVTPAQIKIDIPAPIVNVAPVEVIVPTPIVNVDAPIVNISPTQVDVPAPVVNVAAAQVKVDVPTPIVNVNPVIERAGGRRKFRVLERDEAGHIKSWEEATE